MRLLIPFLLRIGLLTICLTGISQEKWEKIAVTCDSISIYRNSSLIGNVYEYKAICRVNATPQAVYESAIADETYRGFNRYVTESKTIKTNDINTWFVYQRFAVPFLNDRDYTLCYNSSFDNQQRKYTLTWKVANEKGPAIPKDVVRLQTCYGNILIWPDKQSKKTFLQYQICTNPEGKIPIWVINLMNKSTIPDVLRAIASHSKS